MRASERGRSVLDRLPNSETVRWLMSRQLPTQREPDNLLGVGRQSQRLACTALVIQRKSMHWKKQRKKKGERKRGDRADSAEKLNGRPDRAQGGASRDGVQTAFVLAFHTRFSRSQHALPLALATAKTCLLFKRGPSPATKPGSRNTVEKAQLQIGLALDWRLAWGRKIRYFHPQSVGQGSLGAPPWGGLVSQVQNGLGLGFRGWRLRSCNVECKFRVWTLAFPKESCSPAALRKPAHTVQYR